LHIEVFGAVLVPRLRRQIAQRLNAQVISKYSSNETNAIAIFDEDNLGTLCEGVDVHIVDAAGRNLPFGESGTIRVQSETMVHGYFNEPAMTAAALFGWAGAADKAGNVSQSSGKNQGGSTKKHSCRRGAWQDPGDGRELRDACLSFLQLCEKSHFFRPPLALRRFACQTR
jgi:acyl-CoA synthetase (AMP-forming)/AMP-acid ligase II